ncbi:hypothetical protein GCM10027289_10370 [Tsukamurella serpentis]
MIVRVHNIHERVIDAPVGTVAPLLRRLGGPDDLLWPSPSWEPMLLDGPAVEGADGGHGSIRYRVDRARPDRIRFRFHSMPGVDGFHEISVVPKGSEGTLIRHVLEIRASSWMWFVWRVYIEPLHDAVLEDLLDNAERVATRVVARPARWTLRVRVLRTVERVRVRAVPIPVDAELAHRERDDWARVPGALVDAFQVPLWRGHSRDPQHWADSVFRDPPAWVRVALSVRQAVAEMLGIDKGTAESFATLDRTESEVLLGEDAAHLRFRASVLVSGGSVTVSTVAAPSNAKGSAYLAVVRRVHPSVIRAMLRRAHSSHRRSAVIGTNDRRDR